MSVLECAFPDTDSTRLREVLEAFNKYKDQFGFTTYIQVAHFLGQMGFESSFPPAGQESFEAFRESCFYRDAALRGTGWSNTYCHLYVGYNDSDLTDCNHQCDPIDSLLPAALKGMPFNAANKHLLQFKRAYLRNGSNDCNLMDLVYSCRNGNSAPSIGDGSRYRGAGFTHLTWRDNFDMITELWNCDSINSNDQEDFTGSNYVETYSIIDVMMKIAMYFWTDGSTSPCRPGGGVNALASNLNNLAIDFTDCIIDEVGVGVNGRNLNDRPCGDPRGVIDRRAVLRSIKDCIETSK